MTTRKGPPSPLLTPQGLTPKITTDYSTQTLSPKPSAGYSTKLWDARPSKYSRNIIKKVCVFIFLLTICEEVASYAVNQSLKNFFQRLGWSNKGSNSMKLTYDSLSQFACIPAGYISDEFLGKFKTLLGAASSSSVGFVLITLAALPSIRATQSLSQTLFCVGLFGGVALNQVCLRALTVSFGGDQFSITSPPRRAREFLQPQLLGLSTWHFFQLRCVPFARYPWLWSNPSRIRFHGSLSGWSTHAADFRRSDAVHTKALRRRTTN